MENYISFEKLIDEAKKQGLDLGKGDPYNRLRYYTKMGWLPHMIRKKGEEEDVKGHYPAGSLKRLILIEKMKEENKSNDEISRKLTSLNKWDAFTSLFDTKSLKSKILVYSTLLIIIFVVIVEAGLVKIGKPREYLRDKVLNTTTVTTLKK